MMVPVRKVCPREEDLMLGVKKPQLQCQINNCNRVFSQSAALRLHTVKVHKIIETESDRSILSGRKGNNVEQVKEEFHCPMSGCYFNAESPRFFKSLKMLKSHYMRVHAEKKFRCSKCNSPFGLERDYKSHRKKCCVNFFCSNCNQFFDTMELLREHKLAEHRNEKPVGLTNISTKIIIPNMRIQECSIGPARNQQTLLMDAFGATVQTMNLTNSKQPDQYTAKYEDNHLNTGPDSMPHINNLNNQCSLNDKSIGHCSNNNVGSHSDEQGCKSGESRTVEEKEAILVLASMSNKDADKKNLDHPSHCRSNFLPSGMTFSNKQASKSAAKFLLPKLHTILIPMQCEIQPGNQLIIKSCQQGVIGISDPGAAVRHKKQRNTTLLPKPSDDLHSHKVLPPSGYKVNSGSQTKTGRGRRSDKSIAHHAYDAGFRKPVCSSVSIGTQTRSHGRRRSVAGTQTSSVKKVKYVIESQTQTLGKSHSGSSDGDPKQRSAGCQVSPKSRKRSRHSDSTTSEPPKKISHSNKHSKVEAQKPVLYDCEQVFVDNGKPLENLMSMKEVQTNCTEWSMQPHMPSLCTEASQTRFACDNSVQTHSSAACNTVMYGMPSIETQTFPTMELANNTTQTKDLWEELQLTLGSNISTQTFPDAFGESTSTQTLESFLSSCDNQNLNAARDFPQQSIGSSTNMQQLIQTHDQAIGSDLSYDPLIGNSAGVVSSVGHFGVQTESSMLRPLDNFLSSAVQTSDFSSESMNMETQTVDEMFQQFLNSIQTQTCNTFLQDLQCSDIETQTNVTIGGSLESGTQTQTSMNVQQDKVLGNILNHSQNLNAGMQTMDEVKENLSFATQTENMMDSGMPKQSLVLPVQDNNLSTVQTQTNGSNSTNQDSFNSINAAFIDNETQTLLESLGLQGTLIDTHTQTNQYQL